MDIVAAFLFVMMLIVSISSAYALYQLRKARMHIDNAIKICERAVTSLRSGGG